MTKITWFGHAAFQIEMAGKIVLVDPWLDRNPTSPVKASEIRKADLVYVTHDHSDHLGDAFSICKNTDATFVAASELGSQARQEGVKKVAGMNIGGSLELDGVKLSMVQAFHTAGKAAPTGIMVQGEGKSVYHAGDTGVFGDMQFIGKFYEPDVALIPIGGYYTMDAAQAVEAARLIKPKAVIPMHYKTFPVLAQSADEFMKKMKEKAPKVEVVILSPGGSYEF